VVERLCKEREEIIRREVAEEIEASYKARFQVLRDRVSYIEVSIGRMLNEEQERQRLLLLNIERYQTGVAKLQKDLEKACSGGSSDGKAET
jgi:hypothetical protein